MRNPVFEPTPPALSPRARAEEELAVALACGSLRGVERLETEALDPKLDQRARLRASRALLEAAISLRRTERADHPGRQAAGAREGPSSHHRPGEPPAARPAWGAAGLTHHGAPRRRSRFVLAPTPVATSTRRRLVDAKAKRA